MGTKEGPLGAPWYAGAASRACCGGRVVCCYEGCIPGHIEMVPVQGLQKEGQAGVPLLLFPLLLQEPPELLFLPSPFPLPLPLPLSSLLGLGAGGGGAA
jgi:hypothetical protein